MTGCKIWVGENYSLEDYDFIIKLFKEKNCTEIIKFEPSYRANYLKNGIMYVGTERSTFTNKYDTWGNLEDLTYLLEQFRENKNKQEYSLW